MATPAINRRRLPGRRTRFQRGRGETETRGPAADTRGSKGREEASTKPQRTEATCAMTTDTRWPRLSCAAGVLLLALVSAASVQGQAGSGPCEGYLESENFCVAIVNEYSSSTDAKQSGLVWADWASGAASDFAILSPTPPGPGWWFLGHVPQTSYKGLTGHREYTMDSTQSDDFPYTIAVKPKPGNEDILRTPREFERRWDDSGSGSRRDGAVFEPLCDPDYSALGLVGTGERYGEHWFKPEDSRHERMTTAKMHQHYPQTRRIACVRNDAVAQAEWRQAMLWDAHTGDSEPDDHAQFWAAKASRQRPGRLALVPNTFWFADDRQPPPTREAKALNLRFTTPDPTNKTDLIEAGPLPTPRLDDPDAPPTMQETRVSLREIPFFMVEDPEYPSQIEQWQRQPKYQLRRTARYEYVTRIDNRGHSNQAELEYGYETGWSRETSWSNAIGVTVGLSVTVEPSVLGTKGGSVTASIESSYSYEWGGATGRSAGESIAVSNTVDPGKVGALYKVQNRYKVLRMDGEEVPGSDTEHDFPQVLYVEWSPPSCDWARTPSEEPAYGGAGGADFGDPVPTGVQRVKRIWVRAGGDVEAIQTTWVTTGGNEVEGPRHGGGSIEGTLVELAEDEFITKVAGRTTDDGRVRQLTLQTNTGRVYGPFGEFTDGTPFSINDVCVAGFHGRAGARLDAIGVLNVEGSSATQTAEAPATGTPATTPTSTPAAALAAGLYTIQQKSSGRYVQAYEDAGNDWMLVTRDRADSDTQKWTFTPVGDGLYTIQQKSTGRYADAHVVETKDWALVTRRRQNDDTQQWILTPIGDGAYTIQQKRNGRYVDAHGGTLDYDYRLVTRDPQNNDTQRWVITRLE